MESVQSSSTISKILDTRIGADGSLYYQVKYKKAWVSEDALQMEPNLVEKFWKFIEMNRNAGE